MDADCRLQTDLAARQSAVCRLTNADLQTDVVSSSLSLKEIADSYTGMCSPKNNYIWKTNAARQSAVWRLINADLQTAD